MYKIQLCNDRLHFSSELSWFESFSLICDKNCIHLHGLHLPCVQLRWYWRGNGATLGDFSINFNKYQLSYCFGDMCIHRHWFFFFLLKTYKNMKYISLKLHKIPMILCDINCKYMLKLRYRRPNNVQISSFSLNINFYYLLTRR